MPATETPDVVTRVLVSEEETIGKITWPKMYCAQMFCKEIKSSVVAGKETRRFEEIQFGEWKPTRPEAIDSLETKIKIHGMKKVFP